MSESYRMADAYARSQTVTSTDGECLIGMVRDAFIAGWTARSIPSGAEPDHEQPQTEREMLEVAVTWLRAGTHGDLRADSIERFLKGMKLYTKP